MPQQLITQCPECRSKFNISRDQLHAAGGRVRCGNCQLVFVATEHLETGSHTHKPDDAITAEPLTLSPRRQRSGLTQLLWSLLILLALCGMGLQVLWFERAQLSLHPQLQSIYSQLCQQLDCKLPPRQDLPSIQSQRLLLRQHLKFSNALTLDLTLINQAPFEQPFPALKLSFSGLDDSLRASRTFQPREYLGGDLHPEERMPRRSPVQVHLEMLDPGTLAPNYQLQFVQAKQP